MKKILIAVLALVLLVGAAVIVRQNLPSKRFARHLTKARLFVREKNYTAARLEYELAFNSKDGFTPYANLEVLNFTNQVNLQEKNVTVAIENTKKYLEANPKSKDANIMLSQMAFKGGDFQTAFEAVYSALELDPNYFPARLLLTEVRTKQGRLDLAEEQLRFLYKAYPESVLALLPLSENMLRQGRVTEARSYIEAALLKHPSNASARLMLLDSYLLEGKADSAHAVLDAWQKADPSLTLATQVRKAQIQSLSGKLDEAEQTLTPYLEAKEENLPAYFELAMIKAKQGRFDSAVKIYSSMAEINPPTAAQPLMFSVYLNLKAQIPARSLETLKGLQIRNKGGELPTLTGVAYLALGQDAKLAAYIDEQPDTLRAGLRAFLDQFESDKQYIGQWALVNYYTILRQPRLAAEAIKELHAKWPKNKLATTLWSGQLASQGHFAEAAKLLETLADLSFPQKATLLSYYVKYGQRDKTLALGQALLKEHPNQRGLNLFLADFFISQNDKVKAAEYYEKELTFDPENLIALNNLAWEYGINQADLTKAAPYLEKLKTKKMLDPRILDTIGWILAKNGKQDEALGYFHTAINLVPDHPGFNYHIAFLLSEMGKKDEAKKFLEKALSSKIIFGERKDAEKLMATLG
jgi:tetratricopeptide (TPR) repeat protein